VSDWADDRAIVGIDVGTTSVKVGLYSADGTEHTVASRDYPLHTPRPGWVEQDPDEVVDATLDAVAEVVAHAGDTGIEIAGVSTSTAMHSLLGVDGDGTARTPMSIWADTRAWRQAEQLRADHLDVYRRTGAPLHPMTPLAKLCWIREEQPACADGVERWITAKEHLLTALTGHAVIDHASASATGLCALEVADWDDDALDLAGVDARQLATVVPTDHVLDGLTDAAVRRTGLAADTPVVVGATDGVLANLGVGALRGGLGAVSIGTSGAVRVTVDRPVTDERMRLFCYPLTSDRWVVGGAISNGGLWIRWLREQLLGADLDADDLTELAADVPPGADGVTVLPYLTGERAPQWSPTPSGVVFGLQFDHGRGHLVRAGLEGVAHQLRLVTDAMADCGHPLALLRATGGFTNSPLWLRLVADILEIPLALPRVREATAFGAGLLGMVTLGMLDALDDVDDLIVVTDRLDPGTDDLAVHRAAHARYAELVEVLSDPFDRLAADRMGYGAGT
jgi:gluconokinase